MKPAIVAKDIWKEFKVYQEKNLSLKETFLRGRRATYESFWALKGVSFEVPKGETFGIIGENGSGKSTLLKILAHILRPQKGEVGIEGKVSALLELGAGFHPDLTGRENVYLNGSILGLSRQEVEEKFEEIVAFSELEQFIDTPVKSYSSGMYVRLGFAVAINVNPDILLIDEILAVGDESFQRKCLNKIYEFKNEERTIVIVSHDLNSVRNICDEVIWLDEGKIEAQGKAGKVVQAYLDKVNLEEERKTIKSQSPPSGSHRWGSGEIKINKVKLLDEQGREKTLFNFGQKFVVEMEYKAYERINRPVFGIAIYARDGYHCTGTNTRLSGFIPEFLEGEGKLRYVAEKLLLLNGDYLLSVAVHDFSGLHYFDFHERLYSFRVSSGENSDLGVFGMACQWE